LLGYSTRSKQQSYGQDPLFRGINAMHVAAVHASIIFTAPIRSMSVTGILQQLSAASLSKRSKIRHMKAFHSGREAKEFLISELVAEAQRENVPLSEVERKMLYFTESGWTLPDIMKVSEDFDREYDQDKYEQKISKLVTKADRRIRKGSRVSFLRPPIAFSSCIVREESVTLCLPPPTI
jgi:hypothetical protein